jgi:hypothetical protein
MVRVKACVSLQSNCPLFVSTVISIQGSCIHVTWTFEVRDRSDICGMSGNVHMGRD